MSVKVIIDNTDISAVYGLELGEGSIASLIQWAALKEPYINDWHEEDGVEPDLSNPVLDTRNCTLSFVGNATLAQVDAFMELWSGNAYHKLNVCAPVKTDFEYELRLVKCDSVTWMDDIVIIKMTFADDAPFTISVRPSSSLPYDARYHIPICPLSTFGVRVLDGAHRELLNAGDVKPNAMRSLDNEAGVVYDSTEVRFKPIEVRIPCLMRAANLSELYKNYYALLSELTAKGGTWLVATPLGKRYNCYYVSQHVRRAYFDNPIWVEFDITLCVYTKPVNISTYELDYIQQE